MSDPPTARRRRYGWIVALVACALIVYVSLNTLRSDHVSSRGPKAGSRVPPFAAPLALGPVNGDVNVARKAGEGEAGHEPACSVRGPGILNSCQLAEGGPFVLAFVFAPVDRCRAQVPLLEAAAKRNPTSALLAATWLHTSTARKLSYSAANRSSHARCSAPWSNGSAISANRR